MLVRLHNILPLMVSCIPFFVYFLSLFICSLNIFVLIVCKVIQYQATQVTSNFKKRHRQSGGICSLFTLFYFFFSKLLVTFTINDMETWGRKYAYRLKIGRFFLSTKKYWYFFFLFLHENICCGYSLEALQWGSFNFFLFLHKSICCWYSLEVFQWVHNNICFHGETRKIFTPLIYSYGKIPWFLVHH